ncbi:hypothetical protein [Micromonospora chersina]|uniref:hypothetical protein n=1 Tax=Micromonospora chersina TaxID=47854 RepID=UPI003713B4B5
MDHDMPPQVGPTPRAFPVPRPAPDDHPRLTDGLLRAVAACLNVYGWPQAQGRDMIALREAVDWFLFRSDDPADVRDLDMPAEVPPLPAGRDGWRINTRRGAYRPNPQGRRFG